MTKWEVHMTDCIQIVTTVETKDRASAIAKKNIEEHLGACVQTAGPISSLYWWRGKMESAEEWYCIIKTTAEKYEQVEHTIRAIHSYDEPEIVAFPIIAGSRSYLQWIQDSTK